MTENKIYNVIVEDYLPKLKSNLAELIVADPPFNKKKKYDGWKDNMSEENYLIWVEEWIKEGFRILKNTGTFWIYCPASLLGNFQMIGKKYGVWQNTICWNYKYGNPPNDTQFSKIWSAWLVFSKKDKFQFFSEFGKSIESITEHRTNTNKTICNVWDDIPKLVGGYLAQSEVVVNPGTKERLFVYQLPIVLLKRIIGFSTKEGDLIIDMFSHSGTTSVVAKIMGRNSIGIEQSKFYCKEINKRLKKVNSGLI